MASTTPLRAATWKNVLPSILEENGINSEDVRLVMDYTSLSIERFSSTSIVIIAPQKDPFNLYKIAGQLNSINRELKKIAIVDYYHSDFIEDLKSLGIHGVLSVNSIRHKLKATMSIVNSNRFFYDSQIQSLAKNEHRVDEEKLTPREQQIIAYISQGLTSAEIGDELCLSEHTIKSHRKAINKKLDVHNPSQLVQYALANNLSF